MFKELFCVSNPYRGRLWQELSVSSSNMNILYLCHRIPYPPDKGDKIRSYHIKYSWIRLVNATSY
jgi:hypothetical protein